MLIGVVCLAATLAATAKADDPPWQDPYSYWNQDSLNTYQKPANDRIFFQPGLLTALALPLSIAGIIVSSRML